MPTITGSLITARAHVHGGAVGGTAIAGALIVAAASVLVGGLTRGIAQAAPISSAAVVTVGTVARANQVLAGVLITGGSLVRDGVVFAAGGISGAESPGGSGGLQDGSSLGLEHQGVRLRDFAVGPDPVQPTAGVNGLAFLVPVDEPLSVGPPPIAPALAVDVEVPYQVRRTAVVSGQTATLATDVEGSARPRWRVQWRGLTHAEMTQVVAFLRDTCEGKRFAWELAPDGLDTPAITVRSLEDARSTWVMKTGWSVEVEAEEVF